MSDLLGMPKLLSKKQMIGGYAIPEGIFRIEHVPSDTSPAHTEETHSNLNYLKQTLYPIVKEFIQKQERFGNSVKFSRFEPQFLYVH